jgi:hypothetical protein
MNAPALELALNGPNTLFCFVERFGCFSLPELSISAILYPRESQYNVELSAFCFENFVLSNKSNRRKISLNKVKYLIGTTIITLGILKYPMKTAPFRGLS